MKVFEKIGRPVIMVIFGALLLLFYLNNLSLSGPALVVGIFATLVAAYYLAIGIISIVIPNKINEKMNKIFAIIDVTTFPIFMFIVFLMNVIVLYDMMGPTGWVIAILSMVVSLTFACLYIIYKITNKEGLKNLIILAAAIFVLALLLNVLFSALGNAIVLGDINIIGVVIYMLFTYILYISLFKAV